MNNVDLSLQRKFNLIANISIMDIPFLWTIVNSNVPNQSAVMSPVEVKSAQADTHSPADT